MRLRIVMNEETVRHLIFDIQQKEQANIKTIISLYKKYKEIIDYLFWGVMTTIVSWGTYAIFSLAVGMLSDNSVIVSGVANVLSIVCAIAFAYVTNKLWVFGSKSWDNAVVFPELAKFLSARLVTAVVETAGVPALVALGMNGTVFGIEGMIAKAVVSVVVIILNYVFSKLFVFKK